MRLLFGMDDILGIDGQGVGKCLGCGRQVSPEHIQRILAGLTFGAGIIIAGGAGAIIVGRAGAIVVSRASTIIVIGSR